MREEHSYLLSKIGNVDKTTVSFFFFHFFAMHISFTVFCCNQRMHYYTTPLKTLSLNVYVKITPTCFGRQATIIRELTST
jgi:hypothetical protein